MDVFERAWATFLATCGYTVVKPPAGSMYMLSIDHEMGRRALHAAIGTVGASELTTAPLSIEEIRKVLPPSVYKTYAPDTDYCKACAGWHEPPVCGGKPMTNEGYLRATGWLYEEPFGTPRWVKKDAAGLYAAGPLSLAEAVARQVAEDRARAAFALGRLTGTSSTDGSLEQLARARLAQHRRNLAGWEEPGGHLVPTEPDPGERVCIRNNLRAAIQELETVLGERTADSA
jgi:hypothetical protein